jgi:hypothetical protein
MKIIKISLIMAVVASFYTTAFAAPRIFVSCKTFDFFTNQQQTYFHPGDKVLVVVRYSFSGQVASSVTLSTNATLKLGGISMPFTLNPSVVQGPNASPEGGPLLNTSGTQSVIFRIPKHTPSGSAVAVFLTVSAPGFDSGQCNTTIHIVHP